MEEAEYIMETGYQFHVSFMGVHNVATIREYHERITSRITGQVRIVFV
jgi:hypothetical protein